MGMSTRVGSFSLKQLLLALLILFYNTAIRSLIIFFAEFSITIRDPSLSLCQGGLAYSPRDVAESVPGLLTAILHCAVHSLEELLDLVCVLCIMETISPLTVNA